MRAASSAHDRCSPATSTSCGAGRRIAAQPVRATAQQRHRTACVAAQRVRQPDSYLSKPLPHVALGRWGGLPGRLEHFMRVERAPVVQQSLGNGQSLGGRQRLVAGARQTSLLSG